MVVSCRKMQRRCTVSFFSYIHMGTSFAEDGNYLHVPKLCCDVKCRLS